LTEKTCNYSGPVDVLTGETPGETVTVTFTGTTLAISAIAGLDAGVLEITIDGLARPDYDLFDAYCPMFHRPVFHVLAHGLPAGTHTAALRIAGRRHAASAGHAARLRHFAAA
jgi:sialidase-1